MSRQTRRRVARLEAHHQQAATDPVRETIVAADGQRWTRIANGLVVPEVAATADAWQAQAVAQQQSLVNSEG